MRKVERFKNDIAVDEYIVFAINEYRVGYGIEYEWEDWVEIKPKYYIDTLDSMIFEIWYDRTGIIIDRGLNTHNKNDEISTSWGIERFKEINKESAMTKYKERLSKEQISAELDAKDAEIGYYDKAMMKKELISYNNKNLMKRDKQRRMDDSIDAMAMAARGMKSKAQAQGEWVQRMINVDLGLIGKKDNGGSSDWYLLPNNAKTLQDLIEHRNMNGAVKDMFKACYRLGIKTEDELRDLNKTAYYALREIGRVSGRKDYITIAKELIGSQAIEKE